MGRSGDFQTYTMRTRLSKDSEQSEMNLLFGNKIEVSHLTDGVIAFQSEGSATSFIDNSAKLDGFQIFEVNSHELFKLTIETKAVVVLMHDLQILPDAYMLSAALKKQPQLDS